ncbi:MAG: hypothetical protein IKQ04_01285 [Oscillospiraceae bacterium]|nr:hypothetical protein [Oscillospiraceae bacterium]
MNWTIDGTQRLACTERRVEFRPFLIARLLPLMFLFVFLGPRLIWDLVAVTRGEPTALLRKPFDLAVFVAVVAFAWLLLELRFGRSLIIDELGVTQRFLFRSTHLDWRHIRDYGYAYAGFGQARLYFADERQESDGDGRKRRAGRRCSVRLRRTELRYTGQILNVCRQYTRVRPYLCTEDGKLLSSIKDR